MNSRIGLAMIWSGLGMIAGFFIPLATVLLNLDKYFITTFFGGLALGGSLFLVGILIQAQSE